MFASQTQAIVIPQSEHARLAGVVASLWGNQSFTLGPLDSDTFTKGVLFHDHVYGSFDTLPIRKMSEADRWPLYERNLAHRFGDPRLDLIIAHHWQRLASWSSNPETARYVQRFAEHISSRATRHDLDQAIFARLDTITDFCDSLSFGYCFQADKRASIGVSQNPLTEDRIEVTFSIAEAARVTITPWPLRVERYEGFIVGYQEEHYPHRLEPVLVPFTLLPTS
ncbi:MAG: hypothetical protein CL878_02785 [Dehalococcoidia bacterium]|nr:hypothetical protein [Dehalococcoidia bacterium]